jgi:hypothetical protein
MRVLFIGVLAATLVACTTLPHPEASATRKPVASKVDAKNAKSIKSKKTKAIETVTHTGSTTPSPAAQPKRADPITEKAKAAIAAMLENPVSAEFYNLQRARKNLLHTTVDTICGYVKAKNASGVDIGGMPFLYIVGDDEAYLVNGRSHVAETVHSALCKVDGRTSQQE